MSAHPGVASPRRRSRVAGPVVALCSLLVFAACDQPTQPEPLQAPQFATGTSDACPALPGVSGNAKTANVNVTLSTGAKVAGVVVTLIDPVEKGTVCSALTDGNGTAKFTNLTQGAKFLLTVRDEISGRASELEIAPAAPNALALDVLWDEPSLPTPRQRPTLVSGGLACGTFSALNWSGWAGAYQTPCLVPTTGPANFNVNLQLQSTGTVVITVVDPNGNPDVDMLVAAVSTPGGDITDACATMPWVNQANCTDPNLFSGPGLLQAMTVKHTGVSAITFGVAPGSDPLYIEVTAPGSGFTLFGSTVIGGIQQTSSHEHIVYLEPGMCRITTVDDAVEPSGSSALDIKNSSHSIGMLAVADGIGPMQLQPVPSTIVVKSVIHATTTGGTGNFNMQYAGTTGGNKSIRISFSMTAASCSVHAASGNGIGGGVAATGYCAKTGTVGTGPDERAVYAIFFVVTGLPELSRADYKLDADKDNLDPSRADGQDPKRNLARGSIQILDLNPASCPIPENNDPHWIVV